MLALKIKFGFTWSCLKFQYMCQVIPKEFERAIWYLEYDVEDPIVIKRNKPNMDDLAGVAVK
jgi:hypothetical protein